ncbi:P-loop containing nucleoside triphosphate hydrolase protein [Imleria badia]|nr:P-loop containing nucleoside triphosphate hydrolase protein [Imleria badia]
MAGVGGTGSESINLFIKDLFSSKAITTQAHPKNKDTIGLMSGASAEECQHLHLADKTQYQYLDKCADTGARPNGVRDDDANRFEQLKLALRSIGLSNATQGVFSNHSVVKTFIDVFDLPGPQNMMGLRYSLNQFCINYANEHLHNSIQKCMFESHVNGHQTEGISYFVPSVPYFDNAECIRLLQNKPGDLIHIMDDQAH